MHPKSLAALICASSFLFACSDDDGPLRPPDTTSVIVDAGTTADEGVTSDQAVTDGVVADSAATDSMVDSAATDSTVDTVAAADSTVDTVAADSTVDTVAVADSTVDTTAAPDSTVDSTADTTSLGDAGVGKQTIGAAGGTLTSIDGKATLVVPAGALTADTDFAIARAVGAPAGNIGAAYDIEPTGTDFAIPATLSITYTPGTLGGTDENTLRLATPVNGTWSGLPGGSVDIGTDTVTGKIQHLSPYGVASYGTGAVASIFFVHPGGSNHEPGIGDDGGTMPLRAVPLDASNVPIVGKTFTYTSSDPSKLAVDANTGDLTTVSVLQPPYIDLAWITATETVSGVSGTVRVIILNSGDAAPYMVTLSASSSVAGFPAVDVEAFSYVAGAELLYLQGAASADNPQVADASGYFSQFPPFRARSFYTLKLSGSGYLDSYVNGAAPLESGESAYAMLYLFTQTVIAAAMPSPPCNGTAWDPALAGFSVNFDKSYTGNWQAYVGSAGAQVVYAEAGSGNNPVFSCSETQLTIAPGATEGGGMIIYNIDTSADDHIWVVYKDGDELRGTLIRLGPNSWSFAFPWIP